MEKQGELEWFVVTVVRDLFAALGGMKLPSTAKRENRMATKTSKPKLPGQMNQPPRLDLPTTRQPDRVTASRDPVPRRNVNRAARLSRLDIESRSILPRCLKIGPHRSRISSSAIFSDAQLALAVHIQNIDLHVCILTLKRFCKISSNRTRGRAFYVYNRAFPPRKAPPTMGNQSERELLLFAALPLLAGELFSM